MFLETNNKKKIFVINNYVVWTYLCSYSVAIWDVCRNTIHWPTIHLHKQYLSIATKQTLKTW